MHLIVLASEVKAELDPALTSKFKVSLQPLETFMGACNGCKDSMVTMSSS